MTEFYQQDLFDENGHLTDDTLRAFAASTHIQGEEGEDGIAFTELARLEIAEHLSFCDQCILRYTEFLCDDQMAAPSDLVTPSVMKKLEKEQRGRYVQKWLSMTMAASFAILFWVAGIFSPNLGELDTGFLTDIVDGAAVFSQRTAEISTELTDTMGGFVEKLNWTYWQNDLDGKNSPEQLNRFERLNWMNWRGDDSHGEK